VTTLISPIHIASNIEAFKKRIFDVDTESNYCSGKLVFSRHCSVFRSSTHIIDSEKIKHSR